MFSDQVGQAKYPKQEAEWLITHAWNFGVGQYRYECSWLRAASSYGSGRDALILSVHIAAMHASIFMYGVRVCVLCRSKKYEVSEAHMGIFNSPYFRPT